MQYKLAPDVPRVEGSETSGPGGGIYRNTEKFEQVLREKGYPLSFPPWSSGHDYAAWCEALLHGMHDFMGLRGQ